MFTSPSRWACLSRGGWNTDSHTLVSKFCTLLLDSFIWIDPGPSSVLYSAIQIHKLPFVGGAAMHVLNQKCKKVGVARRLGHGRAPSRYMHITS